MKVLSIIALFLLIFPAKATFAQTSVDWSKIDAKDLSELVRLSKDVLVEAEPQQLFSQNQIRSFRLLESAWASQDNDCFYAGWPSTLKEINGKRFCVNPKNRSDYPKSQCEDGLACNPSMFGPDLCVSIGTPRERSTTFARCESAFNKKGGRYDYLLKLTSAQRANLDQTLALVNEICEKGTIGTQRSTKMCASFLNKVDRLRESQAFAKAEAKAKKNQSPSEVSTGSQTSQEDIPSNSTTVTKKNPADCCSVPNPNTSQTIKSVADMKDAIQKNAPANIRELYSRMEQKYKNSPVCKIQNTMNSEEKFMNGLSHYTVGLHYITESGGNPRKRADGEYEDFRNNDETPEAFVQRSVRELGLDPGLVQQWNSVKDSDETTRRAFKYDLADKIMKKLKSDPQALDRAIEGSFSDRNMKNCTFVSFDAFQNAMQGYERLKGKLAKNKDGIVTIVDYTLPYAARRMFVLNVESEETLFNTWTALGGGNGSATTKDGANPPTGSGNGSYLSTRGFAITAESYEGDWGNSVRLDGQDPNNKNMRGRTIVLHGWPELPFTPYSAYKMYYADLPKRVNQLANGEVSKDPSRIGEIDGILNGVETQLGRVRVQYTNGCLGVPRYTIPASVAPNGQSGIADQLVRDTVKNGSLVYMYSQN